MVVGGPRGLTVGVEGGVGGNEEMKGGIHVSVDEEIKIMRREEKDGDSNTGRGNNLKL